MSNIIFLDIDGVLLPFGAYNWQLDKVFSRPYNYLERMVKRTVGVEALRTLAQERDAKFVLISTWRYLFEDEFLLAYLKGIGLGDVLHTQWLAVKYGATSRPKGLDIQDWLLANDFKGDWWIIDDEDHGVPEGHWIQTDAYRGYQ